MTNATPETVAALSDDDIVPSDLEVDPQAESDVLRKSRNRTDRRIELRNGILWWIARIALFVGILTLWQVAADRQWIDVFFFSKPTAVGAFLYTFISTGAFIEPVSATVQEALYAFLLGSALGIIAGIILARYPRLRRLISPFLTALNALPRVALAPLFILWFGIGLESKVFLGVSLVFFVVLISTEGAIAAVDPEYLKVVDSLGAKHSHRLTRVILPSIVPPLFSGLRVGVIYALLGVVTAEMVASRVGLGQQVVFYSSTFRTDGVMAILFVLALVALAINTGLELIERRLNVWRL